MRALARFEKVRGEDLRPETLVTLQNDLMACHDDLAAIKAESDADGYLSEETLTLTTV